MTLAEIITGCENNSRKAQKELYDLFYDEMMRTALFYCINQDDAEHIVLDSLMDIFKTIGNFRGESSLKTWAKRIVINKSINHYRKEQARKKHETLIEDNQSGYFYLNNVIPDAASIINAKDIMLEVQSLPDSERIVFNLHAIEGYSHKEIAEKMNFAEGTSKWYYSNARKALQEKLTVHSGLTYLSNQSGK